MRFFSSARSIEKGLELSFPYASCCDSGGSLSIATRPARDSCARSMSLKACEPVSQNDPGAAPLSIAILIYEKSSGAYCTSSIMTGGSWICRNIAGSFLARALASRSSNVTISRSSPSSFMMVSNNVLFPTCLAPVIRMAEYSLLRSIILDLRSLSICLIINPFG